MPKNWNIYQKFTLVLYWHHKYLMTYWPYFSIIENILKLSNENSSNKILILISDMLKNLIFNLLVFFLKSIIKKYYQKLKKIFISWKIILYSGFLEVILTKEIFMLYILFMLVSNSMQFHHSIYLSSKYFHLSIPIFIHWLFFYYIVNNYFIISNYRF